MTGEALPAMAARHSLLYWLDSSATLPIHEFLSLDSFWEGVGRWMDWQMRRRFSLSFAAERAK